MKGHYQMSKKEEKRIQIIEKLLRREMKQKAAANILNLSTRQIRRIKKRYKKQGVKGLVHQGRGRQGNRKIPEKEINRAIEIVKDKYPDFGPTFALEKLEENHGVAFSRETLRKAMIKAGIWKVNQQKRPVIHQRRTRRACKGELVQTDGSPHAWFEERAPKCDLLAFIDDATSGVLWAELAESETTQAYFNTSKGYFKKHGKPLAFYVDKHTIFRINNSKDGSSSTADSNGLTQFGRAMKELGIELIYANSAQAKGRVERLNQTLQDRLVKELRLRNINTIKEANDFLPGFIEEFNRKFAVKPRRPEDLHRPLLPDEDLNQILIKKYQRILSKNLEIQYQNLTYQIQTERPTYAMRKAPVTVTEDEKGKVRIYYQGNYQKPKELEYKILEKQPKTEVVDPKLLNKKVDKLKQQYLEQKEQGQWSKHYTFAS